MIIQRITMKNFRKYKNKTIDFSDNQVILLTSPNGTGKTTVVDAIEWCLTGEIGRLKTAFDRRSTNNDERKLNTEGILKNRDADSNDTLSVELEFLDNGKQKTLYREQKEDVLNPKLSRLLLNNDSDLAREFIQEHVGDSFYNFHFCDVQKSFNFQSEKSSELVDLFSDFISNYDDKKRVAENLNLYSEDASRYITDAENELVSDQLINEYKAQRDDILKKIKQVQYPVTKFYSEENVEIAVMNKDELLSQREKLCNCAYIRTKEWLSILSKNELTKKQRDVLKSTISVYDKKGESIKLAVDYGLFDNKNPIVDLLTRYNSLSSLSLSADTISQDSEVLMSLKIDGINRTALGKYKDIIDEKEKRINALSSDILLLTKNNKILGLFSDLSANKNELIAYRSNLVENNIPVLCPVCGSKDFENIADSLILKEADEYIKQNGDAVKNKEIEKIKCKTDIELARFEMCKYIKALVDKEKELLKHKISELKSLISETQSIVNDIRFLKECGMEIDVGHITLERLGEITDDLDSQILKETEEQELTESIQKVLTLLNYDNSNETIQQTLAKIETLILDNIDITNFTYSGFAAKIYAIDSIIDNQRLIDLNQLIMDSENKNAKINETIAVYEELKEIADKRSKDIMDHIKSLSEDEYKKVGPYLCKYYNKLARINFDEGINISPRKEGISLFDDSDKNIVNVLSNGQISVFMLALFFAGINARNEKENMKIFFIDDLTACMDDVNMLSFMDMLKYQLSSKQTMEQLFFATCDERISKLLTYKLKGRGIAFHELTEKDLT